VKKTALLAVIAGLTACYTIPKAESVNPAAGSGSELTFEAKYSDAKGVGSFTRVGVLVNDALTGAHACYVIYSPASKQLVLVKDSGSGGFLLESSNRTGVENSQCILNPTGWSVTTNGNELQMKATVKFKPSFSGKKNIYLYALNKQGGNVLRPKGTWVVP
jgi:hypothetical protein